MSLAYSFLRTVARTVWQLSLSPLLLTSLLILVTLYWVRRRKMSRMTQLIEKLPGPPGLPWFGSAVEVNVEHDELFQRITGAGFMYGGEVGMYKSWLAGSAYIFINKPEFAEIILSSSKYIDKSSEYNYLRPWLGTGLLTSGGAKWHLRRKILTPTFHFRILEDFIDVFQEQSQVMINKLKDCVDTNIDIYPFVTLCTLDIICETAMGRQVNAQSNRDSQYVKAIYKISSIIQSRQSKIWLQPNILFKFSKLYKEHESCIKTLHEFSNNVIKERKEEIMKKKQSVKNETHGPKKRLAFLDLLIEASQDGAVLNNEDIREEVDTFMFEGHDTTSAAICWTIYLISSDKIIEQRVMEELTTVLPPEGEKITMKQLHELKYLECCIKEALRLYPSVPIIGRKLHQDLQLGEYTIPAKTTAIILTYMLHRDPKIFYHPEKFNPDRFLPENKTGRHPFAYIPFSAGPRNCIGQKFALLEEKVVVATVLRSYSFEVLESREDLTLLGELILRPKNGLNLKVSRRESFG